MNSILYMVTRWWLGVLPVDHAGRRAFEETLADWRAEAGKATGFISRARATFLAIHSVVTCVAGVTIRGIREIPQSDVLLRLFLWIAGYVIATAVIGGISTNNALLPISSRGYTIVSNVAACFPIALLLATAVGRTRRTPPGLGLGLAASLLAFVLMGWGLPVANRAFLDANPARYANPKTPEEAAWRRTSTPGEGLMMTTMSELDGPAAWRAARLFSNDLSIGALLERVAAGPQANGWAATRWLSFMGSYLVSCAFLPLLAASLRDRSWVVRYTVVVLTAVSLLSVPGTARIGSEFSVLLWLGSFWIPVVLMGLCLVALRESEPPARIPSV